MKHQQIINAAMKVFSEKGYHGTKVEDVAKKAGVAKGSVYLYFNSKEDLFNEMVKDGIKSYTDLKLFILQKDLSLYHKLQQLLTEEAEFFWNNQEIARFLISSDMVSQKTLYEWIKEMRKLFMDKIEAEFEKGIQRGEVVPGDAKLYTRVFRGVEQQVICYNVIIDREKPDEKMIAETLRTLTEGFFVPDAFCYNIGKDLNE